MTSPPFATWELGVIAKDLPDTPDGWLNKDCIRGVRTFAEGFFCGVVRGMLNWCWNLVISLVELWYNTIMTITNIPLNGMIDNDGSIRCFYEIQTQEVLW